MNPSTISEKARELLSRVRDSARRRACVDELERGGDREAVLEAIAASKFATRGRSPLVAAGLLQGLLARLGYSRLEAGAIALDDIRLACRSCRNARACRHWSGGEGERNAYRRFCPNALAIDTFGVRDARTAANER